jgi:acetylornithine deacetylase/succinyl-diaminopimelate desuccinylase-like protein
VDQVHAQCGGAGRRKSPVRLSAQVLILALMIAISAVTRADDECALDPSGAGAIDAESRSGRPDVAIYREDQLTATQTEAREIFAELINIDTTHSNGDNTRAAEAIAARFRAAGFAEEDLFLFAPAARKGNLVVRYRGANPNCKPLLLLAHLDVVEADASLWDMDPFSFIEKDGYFYGRGVSDDKDEAAIHISNLLRLKRKGFTPRRDIVLALTADEEGGTHNGVQWLLQEHPQLLDAAFGLNEGGGGVLIGGEHFSQEVQTAEKLYLTLELTVGGKGGHSSMPSKDNALFTAGQVLRALERLEFPPALNEVTRGFFEQSLAVTEGELREAIAGVLQEPPEPEAVAQMAWYPFYNASLRTTCAPTMISGGSAENALPQSVTITVNCRLVPTASRSQVVAAITGAVGEGVKIDWRPRSELSAPVSMQPAVLATIERVSRSVWPDVPTATMMSPGGTDSRFLRAAGVPMYGVNGIFIDVEDDRGHARDERIRIRSFYEGLEFLYRLTKALTQ